MQRHLLNGVASWRHFVRSGLLLVALSYFSIAQAGIVFTLGNNPQPDEENITLTAGDTGSTITGTTNQTFADVEFTSTQTLVVNATGTAIVGDNVPLTNFSIALADGGLFGDFILNPFIISTSCSGCGRTRTLA